MHTVKDSSVKNTNISVEILRQTEFSEFSVNMDLELKSDLS